jgi:acyl-CoA reductase-like NAD-dependent aldehyde dehydrogenase
MPATRLLINNRWIASETGKTFATINPFSGEEICQVSEADATHVEKAVKEAEIRVSKCDSGTTPCVSYPSRRVL